MQSKRSEIMPGVYLTYLHADYFKTNVLSCKFVTPLTKESASYNTLLNGVLFRGTMQYPDMEKISARLDHLYGAQISSGIRKAGERLTVGFVATMIDDSFTLGGEKLLEPVADLMGQLFFDPLTSGGHYLGEYVESEKTNLIDSIRAIKNDKDGYATIRLRQEMCALEPYGIDPWGDEETVAKILRRNLHSYATHLFETSRLECIYIGRAEENRVKEALLSALTSQSRGEILHLTPAEILPARENIQVITEKMDINQAKLAVGLRSCSQDHRALNVMNSLFGGCSTSKLFMNVREKMGLCYYISSGYVRSKGIVHVSCGIDADAYERALEEIQTQLHEISLGHWEESELSAAKMSILSSVRALGDSQTALENYYSAQTILEFHDSPEEIEQDIQMVTKERIMRAAQSLQMDSVYFLSGEDANHAML